MYKVFVNDKPIIFTASLKKEEDYPVYNYTTVSINELIYKLKINKYKGVYIHSNNLEKDWEIFKKTQKVLQAAGGLVVNTKREVLFIFRGNKWDLPKGGIEKNETMQEAALREVEEECGVKELEIKSFLENTYHLFLQGDTYKLKQTYWYLMHTSYTGTLVPQIEEGITKVAFKNVAETKQVLKKAYANIKLVYKAYENYCNRG